MSEIYGLNAPGYIPPQQMLPQDYSVMGGWGSQPTGVSGVGGTGLQVTPAGISGFGMGSAPSAGGGFADLFSGFLSKTDANGVTQQGWGMPAIGAAQGIFNAYMGMKQYGLYKDQLKEGKRQFELNYDAQRQTTNSALEDRQRARVASNAGAYQSVGDYMNQNAIRGS